MKRLSHVSNTRLLEHYVQQMNTPTSTRRVEPIAPIQPMKSPATSRSENILMTYECYHQKQTKLKQQFQSFYSYTQRLKLIISDVTKQNLYPQLQTVLSIYNVTVSQLYALDQTVRTTFHATIFNIYHKFSTCLEKLRMFYDNSGHLHFPTAENLATDEKQSFSTYSSCFIDMFRELVRALTVVYTEYDRDSLNTPKGLLFEKLT